MASSGRNWPSGPRAAASTSRLLNRTSPGLGSRKGCSHSKSAAVAASADSFELSSQVGCCRNLQGSGRWWLVISLVSRHLGLRRLG